MARAEARAEVGAAPAELCLTDLELTGPQTDCVVLVD